MYTKDEWNEITRKVTENLKRQFEEGNKENENNNKNSKEKMKILDPYDTLGHYLEWNTGDKVLPISCSIWLREESSATYDVFFGVLNCNNIRIIDEEILLKSLSKADFEILNISVIHSWGRMTNDDECVLDLYGIRAEFQHFTSQLLKEHKENGSLIKGFDEIGEWKIPEYQ
jgi:hypothetical protein